MNDIEIRTAKAAIRAELLAARRVLDEDVRRVLSLSIGERVVRLDAYRRAAVIHTYIGALDGEVETRDLVARALRSGKRVLCPRAERAPRRLEHYEIRSLDDLERTALGLSEPDPVRATRADPAEAGVVIVPGIAFDRAGWRIGYGAGFYDRFLATCEAATVGLAYSFQVRDALPHEAHDVAVDVVVTEVETINAAP
jgi:5-formyltetrahydrofolate cyclo-ligase